MDDVQGPPKTRFTGRKIVYGSIEELISIDARLHGRPPSLQERRYFNQILEEYDPGGKRAHELAEKYRSKSD
jgi:hypothetical protein